MTLADVKQHTIGTVIDARSDGSYIYRSHKGVLNLDDARELRDAIREDREFLKSINEDPFSIDWE